MTDIDVYYTKGFHVFYIFAGVLDDLSIVGQEGWGVVTNRYVHELVSRVEGKVYAERFKHARRPRQTGW